MRKGLVLFNGMLCLGLAAMMGCGAPEETSDTKIINGSVVKDGAFPSVVLLYDQAQGGMCTGTFIRPNVVLTAAHCTMSGKVAADGTVNLKLALINIKDPVKKEAELIATSTKVVRNPQWDKAGRNVNRFDLGLVFFEDGVSTAVSELAPTPARAGDALEIVGYGLNTSNMFDPSSAGIKRRGTNKVRSISGGFIQFSGASKTTTADGTNVAASSGDSGGPLFIDGKVAGVTSGGSPGILGGPTTNLYIDLHSADSKAFLSQHLR